MLMLMGEEEQEQEQEEKMVNQIMVMSQIEGIQMRMIRVGVLLALLSQN
jgi:hypothetical protein